MCSSSLLAMSQIVFGITILVLVFGLGMVAADEPAKKDSDCQKNGMCGWTFTDGFCYHAPNNLDKRYRIHSFSVVHGELYIYTAMSFFRFPLGHPPFQASEGLSFFDLSNELPNNAYRSYRMVGYNWCTLGIEIDADWEVFFIGTGLQDISECCSRISHTQQIIRNRRKEYQVHPGSEHSYPLAFNAFFSDNPFIFGKIHYTIDRMITGTRFFIHIQKWVKSDNQTHYYVIKRYDQKEKLDFVFEVNIYYYN